jgi:hypothetical protein
MSGGDVVPAMPTMGEEVAGSAKTATCYAAQMQHGTMERVSAIFGEMPATSRRTV